MQAYMQRLQQEQAQWQREFGAASNQDVYAGLLTAGAGALGAGLGSFLGPAGTIAGGAAGSALGGAASSLIWG